MTFYILAIIMTCAATVLGLRFLFAGSSILKEWGFDVTRGALVLCRRIGGIYFGLALLFFLSRTAEPSDLRTAVCLALSVMIFLLSGLGLFEFLSKKAKASILTSVISEAIMGAFFVWVLLG
ncbi:hypothetical protein [Spirochaeta cellobiosiphila]|uniref:hypothetical protein n=1 Tax=Spirochaeta cellobiosiphila TaxID=504483 RepID=UPI000405A0CD|nr:hypothetical protein [Spirochaeta cellobiosiphila]